MVLFADRRHAGRELAARVADHLYGSPAAASAGAGEGAPAGAGPLVLGLPRGGVPVAAEVATRLHAPLDAFTVRKLGAPMQPEYAIGAIASGGTRVVSTDAVEQVRLSPADLADLIEREDRELRRRERIYRGDRPFPPVAGRVVIVVDDGLATGASMIAAIRALRPGRPAELIAAVPVASREGAAILRPEVDAVICLATPAEFRAVGYFYRDFGATGDDEVRALLAASSAPAGTDATPGHGQVHGLHGD